MSVPTSKRKKSSAQGIPASSLVRALEVVGDAWTILILKEAFQGRRRFHEFHDNLQIPRQTLMLRLAALADNQIFFRKAVRHRTLIQEYHLTPKGLDLYNFVVSVWVWHQRWSDKQLFLPDTLYHRPCGSLLRAEFICRQCDKPVVRRDVVLMDSPERGMDPSPGPRHSRENESAFLKGSSGRPDDLVATSIVGDRWSNLVLFSLFQGTSSYSDIKDTLGISSNILSSRLKKLVALDLVQAEPNGRRVDYRITPRGEDIYPMLHSLIDWADRWLAGRKGPPQIMIHCCEAVAEARFVCASCRATLRAWDVTVARPS